MEGMHEVIITHVVPERGNVGDADFEPAHTRVYRFEFEDDRYIKASLGELAYGCVSGGLTVNESVQEEYTTFPEYDERGEIISAPVDTYPATRAVIKEADPELERLLAEEEEIERRARARRQAQEVARAQSTEAAAAAYEDRTTNDE